jgi:glucan phosphoethanolaminetransferase (alkaline phosphatase superfamily)
MSSRILNSPRKLTEIEKTHLHQSLKKWIPTIIQTYKTTLFEMIANPYKKGLLYLIVFSILGLLLILINFRLKLHLFYNKIILGIIIIVILSICINVALEQYKLNEDLELFLTLTKPNATKYDYESSSVIQNKLMRKAYSYGHNGNNSSILGGIIGAGLSLRENKND